jgi:SAM-dependent methyltransferase
MTLLGKLFGASTTPPRDAQPCVLNVGGNNKTIPIPAHFNGWRHDLLDIDPRGKPDLLCDARELDTLPGARYDAIYCSHNLEHYLHHHARRVLKGFLHLLKEDGFADIRVPDIAQVMKHCVAHNTDLDDVLYESPTPGGPIMVRDVLWGWGQQIERSGNDFYAHKTGFTSTSLTRIIEDSGFAEVFIDAAGEPAFEIRALAFKRSGPNPHKAALGIG